MFYLINLSPTRSRYQQRTLFIPLTVVLYSSTAVANTDHCISTKFLGSSEFYLSLIDQNSLVVFFFFFTFEFHSPTDRTNIPLKYFFYRFRYAFLIEMIWYSKVSFQHGSTLRAGSSERIVSFDLIRSLGRCLLVRNSFSFCSLILFIPNLYFYLKSIDWSLVTSAFCNRSPISRIIKKKKKKHSKDHRSNPSGW